MSFNSDGLAAAIAAIEQCGMAEFRVADAAPLTTAQGDRPTIRISIAAIDSFSRAPGVPVFDKPDPSRPGVKRSHAIFKAIREGVALPPIEVSEADDKGRHKLYDGFHRLHIFAALGYTEVPVFVVSRELTSMVAGR